MAKAVKVLCDRCECKVTAGSPFCASCGYPTRWATHEERTTWEVHQWKAADRSHLPKPPKTDDGSRRWNPFARKPAAKPALTVVRTEAPAAVVVAEPAVVVEEPAAIVEKPAVVRKPAEPAASTERLSPVMIDVRPDDERPLEDTPATVLALRLLNARVAELDEKLRRLENELDEARTLRRRG